jgi:phage/plasmid-like protein (TIGR03299 family)
MTAPLTPTAQQFVQLKGSAFDPTAEVWGTQGWDAIERKTRHGIVGDAFAAVGYKAWHDLGVVAPGGTGPAELLKLAKADFEVFHAPNRTSIDLPKFTETGEPVYVPGYRDADGNRVQQTRTLTAEDPNSRNVCRINPETGELEILGTTSPNYGIIQHKALFLEFAEALLGLTAPAVATAGVLFGGKQVFMCWKLPEEIAVDGVDDRLQMWMLARTSHDRSIPAQVAIVPVRTVCWNTSRWNMQHSVSKMSIRHTKNPSVAVEQAKKALGINNKYAAELAAETRIFLNTPMTTQQFVNVVTKEFGPGDEPTPKAQNEWDRKMGSLLEEWKADEQANCQGTAWAAINAVTKHSDWKTGFKTKEWEGREAGGRFFRSITDNPDVTNPKNNIVRVIREFAGVS